MSSASLAGGVRAAILLAVIACVLLPSVSEAAAGVPSGSSRSATGEPTISRASQQPRATALQRQTGLTVTIDQMRPVALIKGRPLHLAGVVTNSGKTFWREAQVYLEIDPMPATTKAELDTLASEGQVYGTRLVALNLFDQIGNLPPGKSKPYRLNVPFHRLPIAGTPGVYHVGVSVLAGNRMGRDAEADARADTFVPLLPRHPAGGFRPTSVATLLPLTAPVLRQSNGNFVSDRLRRALAPGGRLRDALNFAAHAPPHTVQVVLDPALRETVEAMARGYVVQTLRQLSLRHHGSRGTGQQSAKSWLKELSRVSGRQHVSLMSWAAPDASALAAASMPGVVEAAVMASAAYAAHHSFNPSIVAWQPSGLSTRRALSVARRAGTSVQVLSERCLPRLSATSSGYPPPVVTLHSRRGPLTAVVTQDTLAGEPLTAHMSALELRQELVAESTVRSLLNDPSASTSVVALPFNWNPGRSARTVPMGRAFGLPSLRSMSLNAVALRRPTPYTGPVEVPAAVPSYPDLVLDAIPQMRNKGRVATGILVRRRDLNHFNQRLAEAGSTAWRRLPGLAAALIRQQAAAYARQISKVTVTGPAFVALSSATGRFPITVSNGLKVPISVRVDIQPQNPALQVSPIGVLRLSAGQRRDIDVVSKAQGSGVTQVVVRLSTPDRRLFGAPWRFNVRATQFGVIIWIAMAAGGAVLFGAAVVRIYRRIRDSRTGASTEPARS